MLGSPESIWPRSGKVQVIGQSAGKSFAYLLGVYLGDGCVMQAVNRGHATTVFRLNTIDRDFAEATRAALQELGATRWCSLSTHAVKGSTKPNHALSARHDALTTELVAITDGKRKLPDGILDWPRDHRLAFIAGLMDSEGFVAADRNPTNRRFTMGFKSCEAWVPDFVRVMESVGIRIGKVQTETRRKPHYKAPVRFTIKMQSWIDAGARFTIKRKQDRVEEWASAGAYERRARAPRRLASETTRRTAAPEPGSEPPMI